MTALIVQSALLIAIAFILGAIAGCLARRAFGAAGAGEPDTVVASYGLAGPAAPAPASAPREEAGPPPPGQQAPSASAPETPAAKAAADRVRKDASPKPAPEPAAAARPVDAVASAADDLKRIRGIGPQNEARLHAAGITTFAQIAAWTRKDQATWGERLAFPGRIEREEWVKQARALAREQKPASVKGAAGGKAAASTGPAGDAAPGTRPRLLKAARRGRPDDLTRIGGIGKAIEKKLNGIGIFHYDQVAQWSAEEAAWISSAIGFPGRVEREGWTDAAARLAAKSPAPAKASKQPRSRAPAGRKPKSG